MNNDNKTTRELALKWWNDITHSEKGLYMEGDFKHRHPQSLTGIEIEHIYLSEHPTETESKGQEPELDLLEGITPGEWAINKTNTNELTIISNDGWHIATLNPYSPESSNCSGNARLIASAPRLAQENKELKEELDLSNIQISTLQNKLSGCESALETAYEQNKLLREALAEIHGFLKVLPALRLGNKQGFDECVNIEGVKELELLASKALNQ